MLTDKYYIPTNNVSFLAIFYLAAKKTIVGCGEEETLATVLYAVMYVQYRYARRPGTTRLGFRNAEIPNVRQAKPVFTHPRYKHKSNKSTTKNP